MERFNTSIKGYNVDDVNRFVDETLKEYSNMLDKLKKRDLEIIELKAELEKEKNSTHIADLYSDNLRLKEDARIEANRIIDDAKRNASKIVNDALLEAEKVELRADNLRRNMTVFKRKLRSSLQLQLQSVDDLDDIKLDD